jgi:hypothetical protein
MSDIVSESKEDAIKAARVVLADFNSVDDRDDLEAAGRALFNAARDGRADSIILGMIQAAREVRADSRNRMFARELESALERFRNA